MSTINIHIDFIDIYNHFHGIPQRPLRIVQKWVKVGMFNVNNGGPWDIGCQMLETTNHLWVKQMGDLEDDEWVIDSGCTKHMTSNKDLFANYEPIDGGSVVLWSYKKGKIIGKGDINHKDLTFLNGVHVSNLAFNLLSENSKW